VPGNQVISKEFAQQEQSAWLRITTGIGATTDLK
jgi:hypothetical protein